MRVSECILCHLDDYLDIHDSDYLDIHYLERSALRASQLKRRIDQSSENIKIVKGELSRDNSPMYKQQLNTALDRQPVKTLRELLEAIGRWNEEHRDAGKNDTCRIVDAAGQSNPELRKEMIYSWEKGLIEDKDEETHIHQRKKNCKNDLGKSGQALTRPLKGKVTSKTGSTAKTSAGSRYRKSGIAEAKVSLQPEPTQGSSKIPSAEPRKNFRKSAHVKDWRRVTQMRNCIDRRSRLTCHTQ